MEIALWAATIVVAVVLLAAGAEKLATPYRTLRVKRPWVDDVTPRVVHVIGTLEVLGAIGLVAPAVSGIAPALVPIAAACIAALMVIAMVMESRHHRRAAAFALPAFTLLLAAAVAVGRASAIIR